MLTFLLILALPLAAQPALDASVQGLVSSFRGTVSLYAKNLDTGAEYALRADEPVRTASTIKLPVLVRVYAEVARGKARMDEKLTLRETDKVSGSGVLSEFSADLEFPVRDLCHLMIVVSDNTATNLLIDRFTADGVNEEMDRLGLLRTRSMRKVRGDGNQLKEASGYSKAGLLTENQRFGLGSSTPREMVRLLELIEKGEVVSPEASKEIIAILKRQQFKDGIGRGARGYVVASKSGSLDRLRSDVGVVYTPGGRIALALTVDDMAFTDYSGDNPGERLLADLAGVLVKGLQR